MKAAVCELHNAVKGNGKSGLQQDVSDLQRSLATIEAYGKASQTWVKVLAGLVTMLIAVLGLYFASLEYRGKTGMLVGGNHTELGANYAPHEGIP
jgi:hypothetical protein